jgi:hypothetical protein
MESAAGLIGGLLQAEAAEGSSGIELRGVGAQGRLTNAGLVQNESSGIS